ncbi:MAG: hypothetical protein AAFU85_33085 [Planctomycetota bacterium]
MSDDEKSEIPGADDSATERAAEDEGPGCLPAILAASVLLGIFSLVICAGGTWYIYQHREVIAFQSLREGFIPGLEQSFLEPEEKAETVKLLDDLCDEIERGNVESSQASAAMERITALPMFEWGLVRAVEAFARAKPDEFSDDDLMQFRRIRRGAELGKLRSIDFRHILETVTQAERSFSQMALIEPLQLDAVQQVVERARKMADRSQVAADPQSDPTLDTILRRQIETGLEKGGF